MSPRGVGNLTVSGRDFGGHGLTLKMQTLWLNGHFQAAFRYWFWMRQRAWQEVRESCAFVFWIRLEEEPEGRGPIRKLVEWAGCLGKQMKLSCWNTKGGEEKKQRHWAHQTLIWSVGKCLATPIWSWFDLVESPGDCCSPNFVKTNKDVFFPFFFLFSLALFSPSRE